MSAQRGFLSEAGSHKPFDELSVDFCPKLVRTSHLMSAQRGFFFRSWFAQAILMSAQCGFLSGAGSHKPLNERSAWIFVRSWSAQAI